MFSFFRQGTMISGETCNVLCWPEGGDVVHVEPSSFPSDAIFPGLWSAGGVLQPPHVLGFSQWCLVQWCLFFS